MGKLFRISAIHFSLYLISCVAIVVACIYEETNYYSHFSPESSDVDSSFKPLFITEEVFYPGTDLEYYSQLFNKNIILEWSSYLGDVISEKDISYLLLNMDSQNEVDDFYSNIITSNNLAALKRRFSDVNDKSIGFIKFLHYAKQIEAISTQVIDPWNEEGETGRYYTSPELIEELTQLYNSENDQFLKNRYWFQIVKARFYSADKNSVITFFDQTKNSSPKNTLYYRAMSYVAGAHYKARNYALSNYLYSIVFYNCKEMRSIAAYNFHPQEQLDFDSSLALTANKEERIALWTLYGYYADQLEAIRQIAKLDIKNENIDFLLAFFINNEESRLNSEGNYSSAQEYKQSIKELLNQESVSYIDSIANLEATSKPHLWYMAAGYFQMLSGNYDKADEYLAKSSSLMPSKPLQLSQHRLLTLVNKLLKIDAINQDVESNLKDDIDWLYNKCPKDSIESFRYNHAIQWSKSYLSSLYESDENKLFSELLNPKAEYYGNQTNIDKMIQYLSNDDKSGWDSVMANQYVYSLSDIYEFESIKYTYLQSGNLQKAVSFMKLSSHAKDSLDCNPFKSGIKDIYECNSFTKSDPYYTKIDLLNRMQELQTRIENGERTFGNFIELGMTFYNISFYGNSREFYVNPIFIEYRYHNDTLFKNLILNSSVAHSYFEKALNAAINNEQRAQCIYLISKCERNDYYKSVYNDEGGFRNGLVAGNDTDTAFLAWNGFVKLKNEYSNTKFYKDVINECGYFRTYISKN